MILNDFEAISLLAQSLSNKENRVIYVYKRDKRDQYYIQNPAYNGMPRHWGVINEDFALVHTAYPNR